MITVCFFVLFCFVRVDHAWLPMAIGKIAGIRENLRCVNHFFWHKWQMLQKASWCVSQMVYQTKPNPLRCSSACSSLYFNFSLVWYRGKSSILKHVCATGKCLSSLTGWIVICTPSMPLIGRRSEPVRKSKKCFLCSTLSSWNTSQKSSTWNSSDQQEKKNVVVGLVASFCHSYSIVYCAEAHHTNLPLDRIRCIHFYILHSPRIHPNRNRRCRQ